ncbi:hypothetical protein EV368DRAFT_64311 [Lentinula lateritia]|uniref:Uncharacterized protein n=1 Tax=Lentinula aff. lateritia TaxID=2804960 RepID=A0ACC1U345_9AGAR|nr:hypothetical protein F5876DRAFT_64952 [Lentinula aff. lateritia]KAJ3853156.1 hypothetical protein EV368DRAFT_64311 [Lentinula lateritia]
MTTLPNVAAIPDLSTDDIRERILGYLSGQGLGQLSHEEMDKIISKLPRLDEKQIIALGHEGKTIQNNPHSPCIISRWVKEGHDSCPTCRRPLLERIGDADTSANSTSTSPAENAYDPSQLADILQHLQGFGIDSFPAFPETQSDASEFFAFLSRPDAHLRRTLHNDDRNEYSAMYS